MINTTIIILIFISLFIMTLLIALGIVYIVKGRDGKKILISGMVIGIIPIILTTLLFFLRIKGI